MKKGLAAMYAGEIDYYQSRQGSSPGGGEKVSQARIADLGDTCCSF